MDVLTDTKMPNRCADAPKTPKHMGCTDVPGPHIRWEKHTDVQGSTRASICLGGAQTYGGVQMYGGIQT